MRESVGLFVQLSATVCILYNKVHRGGRLPRAFLIVCFLFSS